MNNNDESRPSPSLDGDRFLQRSDITPLVRNSGPEQEEVVKASRESAPVGLKHEFSSTIRMACSGGDDGT